MKMPFFFPAENMIVEIPVTDSFVDQHWRKWEPVLDEASTNIKIKDDWTFRQKALAQIGQRKHHEVNRVYSSYYDEYTILADLNTGKVARFNNEKYYLKIELDRMYLVTISTGDKRMVYDGSNFLTTSNSWLMSSKPRLGKKHYLGLEWGKRKGIRTSRLFIRDHVLIAVLYFGEKAIEAIERKRKYDINHRNLNHYDNRPENLEIILKEENRQHSSTMYAVLRKMIENAVGSVKGGFWLHDARLSRV